MGMGCVTITYYIPFSAPMRHDWKFLPQSRPNLAPGHIAHLDGMDLHAAILSPPPEVLGCNTHVINRVAAAESLSCNSR